MCVAQIPYLIIYGWRAKVRVRVVHLFSLVSARTTFLEYVNNTNPRSQSIITDSADHANRIGGQSIVEPCYAVVQYHHQ